MSKYTLSDNDLERIEKLFVSLPKFLIEVPSSDDLGTEDIRNLILKIRRRKNKLFVIKNDYLVKSKKLHRNYNILKKQAKLLEAELIQEDKFKLRKFNVNERAKIIEYRVNNRLENISEIEADMRFIDSFISAIDSTLNELSEFYNMLSRILSSIQLDINLGEN